MTQSLYFQWRGAERLRIQFLRKALDHKYPAYCSVFPFANFHSLPVLSVSAAGIYIHTYTHRQTETDRQTDRQADRQTDIHTHTLHYIDTLHYINTLHYITLH